MLYLPPYSLDLSSIEEILAIITVLLRKKSVRSQEALIGTNGQALKVVSAQERGISSSTAGAVLRATK